MLFLNLSCATITCRTLLRNPMGGKKHTRTNFKRRRNISGSNLPFFRSPHRSFPSALLFSHAVCSCSRVRQPRVADMGERGMDPPP